MTERGCRLVGAAMIAAAGGIIAALGDLGGQIGRRGPYYAEGVGFTMLFVGAGLFLLDWGRSFIGEFKSKEPQRSMFSYRDAAGFPETDE